MKILQEGENMVEITKELALTALSENKEQIIQCVAEYYELKERLMQDLDSVVSSEDYVKLMDLTEAMKKRSDWLKDWFTRERDDAVEYNQTLNEKIMKGEEE